MKYTYYKLYEDKVTYSDKSSSPILPVTLEVGDEVTYVTQEGTYNLISCPEEVKTLCYKCDIGSNNYAGLECFNSRLIKCENTIVKLIHIHNESTVKVSKIKSVLCNEDTCPYYSNECINYQSGRNKDYCLIKLILE